MNKSLLILIAITLMSLLISSPAHAIKKCKDAQGKWHYGDVAVRSCENSKVTTLNDRGFVKGEKDAPKTDQEIASEKEQRMAIEAEAKRVNDEQDERNRILSVYETEADIDRQRDNQLNSVDSNIAVHKSYLKSMEAKIARANEELPTETKKWKKKKLEEDLVSAKKDIEEYSVELASLIEQKEQIKKKFAIEKEVYRTLNSPE